MLGLTANPFQNSGSFATGLLYPVLIAAAVVFLANLCIFPEFSSSFLGETAIKTLQDVSTALAEAGANFVALERSLSLNALITSKPMLRADLSKLKITQNETQFELAYSVLPPRDLKKISKGAMKRLVANTIAVIGACESRFTLSRDSAEDSQISALCSESSTREPYLCPHAKTARSFSKYDVDLPNGIRLIDLNLKRGTRDTKSGDADVLQRLIENVKEPYKDLQKACNATVIAIASGLSLCYVSVRNR